MVDVATGTGRISLTSTRKLLLERAVDGIILIDTPARRQVSLEGESPWPDLGHAAARKLLAAGRRFTAVFAFNDISANGGPAAGPRTIKVAPELIVRGTTRALA